ncbi:MAG: hypothetical protein HQ536_01655 [Parcubacteria group bacterium]|nr:hypothetical protein [Parcubacteria group bacterium]
MTKNTKKHAKEYLLEYSSGKTIAHWLDLLIQRAVDANGIITEENKNQIFLELLKENNIQIEENTSSSLRNENKNANSKKQTTQTIIDSDEKKLTLQKITHKSGVNALDSDQSIFFSQACTMIYGLNGTGKSGYFRIIHELSGGDKTKTILGNIHKQSESLEVDVDFLLDNEGQDPYKWDDKNLRAIVPFNQIKVFDSEYLPFFLNKRESSVNIEPLGLHLFQVITSTIDEFKNNLNELIQQKKCEAPDLESLTNIIHSEPLRSLLQQNSLSKEESDLLHENKTFLKAEETKLAEFKEQKQTLEKKNAEDSQKVLNQEVSEINELNTQLVNLETKFKTLCKNIFKSHKDYSIKKKIRDEHAKQLEILKIVPAQDTDEWQAFVESADDYGKIIDEKSFDKEKNCIHCHQSLEGEALKLVQTYSEYLNDKSQQNYKNSLDEIEKLKQTLNNVVTTFSFSENLSKILEEIKNDKGQTYKYLAEQSIDCATKQKGLLEKILEENFLDNFCYTLHTRQICNKLAELSDARNKTIHSLQQSEALKKQKIDTLLEKIYKLEDKQNIAKSKTKVESYFSSYEIINKLTSVNQATGTTRSITELGSKAHDELLTDSIRQSFEDELKNLGKDIEVTLEPAGSGKGTVFTQLKILGNDVSNILSDGEQKAVGLALFLAEIQSNNDLSPIVFDDPVTSLDHDVADDLAKKLLQLSESRQVIVFTHNKLFKDSLVYWGNDPNRIEGARKYHICKNYTGSCNTDGKHILTYEMRNDRQRTGIIIPYKIQNLNYFINKAKTFLKKDDYDENDVSSSLRLAIDHYVDEKILANNRLRKDKQKNHKTDFQTLKDLNPNVEQINQLAEYYSQVSGNGGLHQYQDYQLKPLGKEDFENIIRFLEKE